MSRLSTISPPNQGKVIVVGGGIAGLSTAWALRSRGFAVELIERGLLPNPKASSFDENRVTRHAYGAMEGYARMMPDAFRTWDALFADIGTCHFDPRPFLVLMREPVTWFEESLRSLAGLGIPVHMLEPGDVLRRYPMIAPDGLMAAFEEEGSGILFPNRILTDLVVHLARAGVHLRAGTEVTDIDPEEGTVRIMSDTLAADHVVVAAGAWVTRLVPELGGEAAPSRQALLYLAPPVDLAEAWASAPILLDLGAERVTYALPPTSGTRLKVGDHNFTRRGDPDDDRAATDEDVARLQDAARHTFRDFERYTILERRACYYTVTENETFIARALGSRATVVSACSGHGFKLGPLVGERVAAAVAGEITPAILEAWAAGRDVAVPAYR